LAGVWISLYSHYSQAFCSIDDHTLDESGSAVVTERMTYANSDSLIWLNLARRMIEEDVFRIRTVDWDSYPEQREIHWSQSMSWLLVIGAKISALFGIQEDTQALELGSIWVHGALFLFGGSSCIFLLWRAAGNLAGLAMGLSFLAPGFIFIVFYPHKPDHHALLTLFTCLTLASWTNLKWTVQVSMRQDKEVQEICWGNRFFALLSGVFIGLGVWVGATQQLVLTVAFIGAHLVFFVIIRTRGMRLKGETCIWLWWIGGGFLTSLFFYLVEYFPSHLQWQPEVNGPLHWMLICGGGGVAAFSQRLMKEKCARDWKAVTGIIVTGLIFLFPIAFVVLASSELMEIKDPLHYRWLDYTAELNSWQEVFKTAWKIRLLEFFLLPTIASVLGLVWCWQNLKCQPTEATQSFLLISILAAYAILTFIQFRWSHYFGLVSWLGMAYLVAVWIQKSGSRWKVVGSALILSLLIYGVWKAHERIQFAKQMQDEAKFTSTARKYHEWKIRSLILADEIPVNTPVLTTASLAPSLIYYSRIRTTGSFYWENIKSVQKLANILSASRDSTAFQQIQDLGYTQILLPASDYDSAMYYIISKGYPPSGHELRRNDVFLGRISSSSSPTFLSEASISDKQLNQPLFLKKYPLQHESWILRAVRNK
ncbi:MAG: hypothetical protein AAF135_25570, partial [Bacteroidota bacterium]